MAVDRGPGRLGKIQTERRHPRIQRSAVLGGGLWRGFDARRERLAGHDHDTPPADSRGAGPHGAAPGVVIVSHRLARPLVFRYPSGSRPGLPVPLADRVTLTRVTRSARGTGRPG